MVPAISENFAHRRRSKGLRAAGGGFENEQIFGGRYREKFAKGARQKEAAAQFFRERRGRCSPTGFLEAQLCRSRERVAWVHGVFAR